MQANFLILLPIVFGVIVADYVGPQNGFRNGNGNGNGNGNAYGVPTDSITPPQPQGGPYPPSGWKPNGRRLLLPGEGRSAQQPIDNGFGQPPPSQYGPVNPSPSGPSIDSQYGPSVGTGPSGPPNNQYIPGTGFGNGNGGNGNGNGNGHNGNGNGHNGNGNGHNGNGNGHNGNGNGHNGNGNGHNGNGNGHNGNGNGHNGNGNGHNGNGNGHNGNGNGHNGNGNGHNGNGNGHNGNGNGNGHNGGNGFTNGGNANGNGNGVAPAFHGAFPGGLIYPFVQHSVPAVLAFRPGNGAGHGNFYPLYQVPTTPTQSGTGFVASSFPTGNGVIPLTGANPSFQIPHGTPDLGAVYPAFQITGAHDVAGSHPGVVGHGTGLIGHGIGQYYTLLSNHQSQKSHILGAKNGLINQQLQYVVGNAAYGSEGVPLGVF